MKKRLEENPVSSATGPSVALPIDEAANYVIVSPTRNEAALMRRTLDSVVNQTLLPKLWVIVDDGSTDDSARIASDYAEKHPFIRVMRLDDRGRRWLGGGVVHVFNQGWEIARLEHAEYVCKLDMDLVLPRNYFEEAIKVLETESRLGSFSGKPYYPGRGNDTGGFDGPLIAEAVGDDASVGMVKLWRRTAFEEIGGLVAGLFWDGIDCYKMRMNGWTVRSEDEPQLRFIHLRPMGSSDRNILVGRQRHGIGHWFMGSSPIFVLMSAVYRLRVRPVGIGSAAMLWGYAKAALTRQPRYQNPVFRRELRRFQHAMLRHGKAGAVRRAEDEGAAIWQKQHGG